MSVWGQPQASEGAFDGSASPPTADLLPGAMKFVTSQGGPKAPADATVIARSASAAGGFGLEGGAHHHTAGCRQGGSTGARGEGAPKLAAAARILGPAAHLSFALVCPGFSDVAHLISKHLQALPVLA